jgi:hypothetical protein
MSTAAKIAANKANAAKSTGPGDTSQTRYNALKSGLTARGLTPMDDVAGFDTMLAKLRSRIKPVGQLEKYLVERIALGMVRRQRGERLEAAYLDADLWRESDPIDHFLGSGPTAMPLAMQTVADLCNISGRYETASARRLHADIQLLIVLQRERGKTGFVS